MHPAPEAHAHGQHAGALTVPVVAQSSQRTQSWSCRTPCEALVWKLPMRLETKMMYLGTTSGTSGAASVTVRSALAQSRPTSGELSASAASASRMLASSFGSQNSAIFPLTFEFGMKYGQPK